MRNVDNIVDKMRQWSGKWLNEIQPYIIQCHGDGKVFKWTGRWAPYWAKTDGESFCERDPGDDMT